MGRDRRNENRREQFTKMIRKTMETEAWAALSVQAQALYPWIKLEWHGPKANNNGKLRLSIRQAVRRLGCCKTTAQKAFHELQAKGFIVQTEPAHLGTQGYAKAPAYEVTEIALPGALDGRRLFQKWHPGSEFEVIKASVNNRRGFSDNLRIKNKTPSQTLGRPVLVHGTKS